MRNKAIVYQTTRKLFVYKDMAFGEWLTEKLKERGWSDARLAHESGYSPTHIGNLRKNFSPNTKSGVGRPSRTAVEKIAAALNADPDEAREAAGYAKAGGADEFDEIDFGSARLSLNTKEYSPVEREDLEEEFAFVLEKMRRKKEKQRQELSARQKETS